MYTHSNAQSKKGREHKTTCRGGNGASPGEKRQARQRKRTRQTILSLPAVHWKAGWQSGALRWSENDKTVPVTCKGCLQLPRGPPWHGQPTSVLSYETGGPSPHVKTTSSLKLSGWKISSLPGVPGLFSLLCDMLTASGVHPDTSAWWACQSSFWGSTSRVSDSVIWGGVLRTCMSNKCRCVLKLAMRRSHLDSWPSLPQLRLVGTGLLTWWMKMMSFYGTT